MTKYIVEYNEKDYEGYEREDLIRLFEGDENDLKEAMIDLLKEMAESDHAEEVTFGPSFDYGRIACLYYDDNNSCEITITAIPIDNIPVLPIKKK